MEAMIQTQDQAKVNNLTLQDTNVTISEMEQVQEVKNDAVAIVEVLQTTKLLGKELSVYGSADHPLFLAKDVAEWIDHSNVSAMVSSVDEDEKGIRNVYTLGGEQEMLFITEDGLYEVLMLSRKPIAKEFKKGVKAILKEIRSKGGYIATTQNDTPEIIMAKALFVAKAAMDRQEQMLKEAENTIEIQGERIELQTKQLTIQAPKVAYYDAAMDSGATYSTNAIAKGIGTNARALNAKLKELGVQYKQNDTWYLYSKYENRGYTKVIPHYYTHSNGSLDNRPQTRWTEKGREFILNLVQEGRFE